MNLRRTQRAPTILLCAVCLAGCNNTAASILEGKNGLPRSEAPRSRSSSEALR